MRLNEIICPNCFLTVAYMSEEIRSSHSSFLCPKCAESFGLDIANGRQHYMWGMTGRKYDYKKIYDKMGWETITKEKNGKKIV